MSWMGAIYTDVCELQDVVVRGWREDEEPAAMGETIQHVHGWVAPTVAGLARTLIGEVMERTPHDKKDIEQMERVIALLGTGE
jgi:hypothetical protein